MVNGVKQISFEALGGNRLEVSKTDIVQSRVN